MNEEKRLLDFNGSNIEIVEVETNTVPGRGITLWVNIDGICRLRVCNLDIDKFKAKLVSLP